MKTLSKIPMLLMLALPAMAITPPTPVEPKLAAVLYTWNHAQTRRTGIPLALAEIKESRIYITSLSAYITVPGPAASYTYVVPSGQCIRATDGAQVTNVDTGGLEGDGSNVVKTTVDVCSGKSLPGAPGNAKVTIAP
jgi:hypothetical protein